MSFSGNMVTEDNFKIEELSKIEKFPFESFNIIYSLCSNGGDIAITNDNRSYNANENVLKKYIIILNNKGEIIYKFYINNVVISLEYASNENLLVILEQGQVLYINIILDKIIYYNLTPKEIFINDPIDSAKIIDNSFLILTKNKKLFFVEDFKTMNKILIEENNETGLEYKGIFNFYKRMINNKDYIYEIYYCLNENHIKCCFYSSRNGSIFKKKNFFQTNNCKIIDISISINGNNIAIFDNNMNVSYINLLDDDQKIHTRNLNINASNIDLYERLLWLENYFIFLVCFKDKIIILTLNNKINISNYFYLGVENLLFFKNEIDGIRILNIKRKKHSGFINLIRLKSKEYKNTLNIIPNSSGAILYQNYKLFIKNKPIEEDVRNNKNMLENGIDELIESAKFELNNKKCQKLLKAASFNKKFLINKNPGDKDIIRNLVNKVKILININKDLSRNMTFRQFKNIGLEKLIDILNSKNQYNLIFNILKIKNKKKDLLMPIYLEYTNKLLKSNLFEEDILNKIKNNIFKLFENEELEKILLKICYDAVTLEKNTIVIGLIYAINNPEMKACLYLWINEYQKALEIAKLFYDSQLFYMIFGKMLLNYSYEMKLEYYKNIINTNNNIEQKHFIEYLIKTNNIFEFKNFVNIKNSVKKSIIQNYNFYKISVNNPEFSLYDSKLLLLKNLLLLNKKKKINLIEEINKLLKVSTILNDYKKEFTNLTNISINVLINIYYVKKVPLANILKNIKKDFKIPLENVIYKLLKLNLSLNESNLAVILIKEASINKVKIKLRNIYLILEAYPNRLDYIIENIVQYLDFSTSFKFCLENKLAYFGYIFCKKYKKLDKFLELKKLASQEDIYKIENYK